MTLDTAAEIVSRLDVLLELEREALLNGDLEKIQEYLEEKESLIDQLNAVDVTQTNALRDLQAKVERNQVLLDGALQGRDWIANSFSVADLAIAPWLRTIPTFYDAADEVGWDDLTTVPAYLDRFLARPAVDRALNIPPRPTG